VTGAPPATRGHAPGPVAVLATAADWPEVAALRHRVFVIEQGVPAEIERDDRDPTAVHALSRDASGAVVATGRLLPDTAGPGRAVIGRMAAEPAVRGAGTAPRCSPRCTGPRPTGGSPASSCTPS
jgi:predicted GNAT family N-acyltransferase